MRVMFHECLTRKAQHPACTTASVLFFNMSQRPSKHDAWVEAALSNAACAAGKKQSGPCA